MISLFLLVMTLWQIAWDLLSFLSVVAAGIVLISLTVTPWVYTLDILATRREQRTEGPIWDTDGE
jgi:hypothetical protein